MKILSLDLKIMNASLLFLIVLQSKHLMNVQTMSPQMNLDDRAINTR